MSFYWMSLNHSIRSLTNGFFLNYIDNIHSDQLPVDYGVPQGTVLGPLLFLLFINDLPESVNCEIKLFADDCIMYRTNNTHGDPIALQQYINKLEQWENTWQMKFNADTCFTIRITNSTGAIHLKNEIVQHILQKRFDLSRW